MLELREAQLLSFRSELRKLAFTLPAGLGAIGAHAGQGMAIGGAVGGTIGAVHGYRKAKQEGGSGLGGALSGGFKGTALGAGVGTMAGGVRGGMMHAADPVAAEKARAALTQNSAFSRFGQRQVHGLTGFVPQGAERGKYLADIKHGVVNRQAAVDAAQKAIDSKEDVRGVFGRVMGHTPEEAAKKQLTRATAARDAAQKAQDYGLTSIPGYVKAIRDPNIGLKKTLRTAYDEQISGSSPAMKGLMLGMPAVQLGQAAFQDPRKRNSMGESKGEALGSATAGLATGLALGPLPMMTQMGLSMPAMAAGKRLGRVFDGRNTPPPEQKEVAQ